MKHNVCGVEKMVRALIGIAIIFAGVYFRSWWGAIGLIPLLTAAVGYCPLSHAFHFSTCSVKTPS